MHELDSLIKRYNFGNIKSPYNNTLSHSAFSTDLSTMFGDPLVTWCYGHTHWYNDITVNGTRVISNPHGYPKELPDGERSYDPHFVVSVWFIPLV